MMGFTAHCWRAKHPVPAEAFPAHEPKAESNQTPLIADQECDLRWVVHQVFYGLGIPVPIELFHATLPVRIRA